MRDALTATTAELVRAAADVEGAQCLALCRERLEGAGFRVDALEAAGALVARRGDDPRLLLSGHVDVVPAGEGWDVAPHGGVVREGSVWGRGASDMLGAVACFLELAHHRPDLPLAVALTTDEETGMEGAAALVEAGLLAGVDAIVIGEPTDLELGLAQKGVFWCTLTARGRSAHGSQPWEGDNAVSHLAHGLVRLEDAELPWRHPLVGEATLVPTVLAAGEAVNVVPDRATARVDLRFPPPATADEVRARVEAALAGLPLTVTVDAALAPFETAPGGALATAAANALEAAGVPVERVGLPYGTEASRFAALGAEMVVLGPGLRRVIHTSAERVPVDNLVAAYRAYEALAEAWRGDGGGG